ncbi:MAG: hypothetical protein R3303_12965 [Marinobacter sp.]|nr:hypothetical protein [Marinobacter sp.]
MLTSARPYIAVLLALVFLLGGSASVVASTIHGGRSACGEMMSSRSVHPGQIPMDASPCHDAGSVVCPGASGISQCVALLALAVCPDHLTIADPGAQAVHVRPSPDYQNPFPKTVNPPPKPHA